MIHPETAYRFYRESFDFDTASNRTGYLAWFEELGQGIEPEEINLKRKRIGGRACYIELFVALNQRFE